MQQLPLYSTVADAAVETVAPRVLDPACKGCTLGRGSKRRCIPAEGSPGGLLVVGEAPGRREVEHPPLGRPFVGEAGQLVRRSLAKVWKGPVCLDYAVRCTVGSNGVGKDSVEQCRGYLAQTLDEVKPTRILAMGSLAAEALLGRSVLPMSVRRGYAWLPGLTVPVFFLMNPGHVVRNHFVRKWWTEDLEWAVTCPDPPAPPWSAVVNVVRTATDAAQAVAAIRRSVTGGRWLAFDVETEGYIWEADFTLLSVALCCQGEDNSWVWSAQALADPAARAHLVQLLTDWAVPKIGQNTKFDCLAVRAALGCTVNAVVGDTRLWRKLQLSEGDGRLEVLGELVGMGGHKDEAEHALVVARKKVQAAKRRILAGRDDYEPLTPALEAALRLGGDIEPMKYLYGMLPESILHPYNARDAVSTARLGELLIGELKNDGNNQWAVWDGLVKDASAAVEQIEAWGVAVDRDAVLAFQAHLETQVQAAEAAFSAYAINPASPRDVANLLYKKLGLPVLRRTDSGAPSTDADTLEKLRGQHPVVDELLRWRKVTKLKGTYADGMLGHIRRDGRVHPTFNLDGARSGRLSCTDPNCQNIPRASSPEGKMARDCFVARPGRLLVQLDYSQLELRIAAALSGDPLMRQIFAEGVDYHLRTAQLVSQLAWGIPPEQVTKEHRSQAKAINFGTLYGLGDAGLAAQIGCSTDQAGRVRQAIMGKFRVLDRWTKQCLRETQQTGLAWTWWAGKKFRKRDLWRIADPDDVQRSVAEHGSWNTPVQGTASDFCLASVLAVVQWILDSGIEDDVQLVLTVHDSIMLEVVEHMVPAVAKVVRDIMLGWDSAGVPLEADIEVGPAWGSLEKYKLAA